MNNTIIVIHRSEIVRLGMSAIIRDLFDIEIILLSDIIELKNYADFTNSRIVLLLDAGIGEKQISDTISQIEKPNLISKILIRDSVAQSTCEDNCDCCFSLEVPKSRIYDLINPHLKHSKNIKAKKNSLELTDRETEVVKLVALGKTNKEIADELSISFHTVISHRKNITEKLGIKTISGLTVYAILNKLIDATTINPES